ncbi:MAG: formylglycine-generating enzyme family protein, partial [Desulfobacteraceae bacterium]
MEFVKLPPSQFAMGLSLDGNFSKYIYRHGKNPKHLVTLTKGFYIQTTEVTQEQWLAIMGENPSYFKNCGKSCPVENVSWDDAQQFIKRLNALEKTVKYRLPTEAEWEYACRAGTDTNFYFGDCISSDLVNFIGDLQINNCMKGIYRKKTVPVRTFPPNSNGLFEMHGNVAEWCQDSFGRRPEEGVDVVDPKE